MAPDAMILVFWMLSFKPTFSLSSFTFIKRLFSSSLLSDIRVVSSAHLGLLIFLSAAGAAAAKSLQSCPTLCNPLDGSPPDSAIPGILQTRVLEWAATSFSNFSQLLDYKFHKSRDYFYCIFPILFTLVINFNKNLFRWINGYTLRQ